MWKGHPECNWRELRGNESPEQRKDFEMSGKGEQHSRVQMREFSDLVSSLAPFPRWPGTHGTAESYHLVSKTEQLLWIGQEDEVFSSDWFLNTHQVSMRLGVKGMGDKDDFYLKGADC